MFFIEGGFYAGYFSITGGFKQSDKSEFEVLIPPFCPAAVCDPRVPPTFLCLAAAIGRPGGEGSVPGEFYKFCFPSPNNGGGGAHVFLKGEFGLRSSWNKLAKPS